MGFASQGACFPTQQAALNHWCANTQSGAYAQSCGTCDASTSSCSITYLLSNGASSTAAYPVSTPACEVPNPAGDSIVFAGAIVGLWILAWSLRAVYQMFRVPHND